MMRGLWKQGGQVVLILFATAALAAADMTTMPPPGALNYVEGQVTLNGEIQSPKSVGSSILEPGQVLDTRAGYAELLLTPGVFLRVGHNSKLQMISPGLTNTQVKLMKGSAMLEVDDLYKQNHIGVEAGGVLTTIEKNGLYDFDATQPAVRVLDGKARVWEGQQSITLKKGHEVLLANGQRFRPRKFDKDELESQPLYAWSELRGEYASEANVETANDLLMYGGWYGPGWYWDPLWGFWSFMPDAGILWGPFGCGFFSPGWVGYAPYYGYPLWHHHYPMIAGRGGRGVPLGGHHIRPMGRGFARAPRAGGFARMGGMGAMRGGMRMGGFGGGGFHGGFGPHR